MENVVGESYYRWEGMTTFYPTLTFHFREKLEEYGSKRTQIKTRYCKLRTVEDVNNEVINAIGQACPNLLDFNYQSGPLRCNYVSSSVIPWKTTIFCAEKHDAINVLNAIMPVLDEPFDETSLSFTTGRRNHVAYDRRETSETNQINENLTRLPEWKRPCMMELNKVMLLVKGLKGPIEVFNRDHYLSSGQFTS